MSTTTLFVCASCGIPVELSRHDSDQMAAWEALLRCPIVVHCVDCAGLFEPC